MEPFPTSAPLVDTKAPLGKRAVALIIDGLIAWVIASVFSFLGAWIGGIGALIGAGYMLVRDGLNLEFANGRSVGKQLMGLGVVRLDGRPMDIETSIRRNWPLAVGNVLVGLGWIVGGGLGAFLGGMLGGVLGSILAIVEIVLVFTDARGRRFGDKFAGTEIVETRPI